MGFYWAKQRRDGTYSNDFRPVEFTAVRMSPARRGPHYSVQDVIDAVQNGESDVDIELDETDEESDDEACGEVDKETQPPTDRPADVDIEPQPAKHAKPQDVRSLHTPLGYFRQFVSEDVIQSLIMNTNEYSLQTKRTSVNTDTKEIEKMLGMYLKMGLVQMA
ncbi:hypothetical protein CRUP_022423 [Coryphaenoides rupestris]|nr:hypothetical protein CRUP_022423 [Coryphaenoides rupestris]